VRTCDSVWVAPTDIIQSAGWDLEYKPVFAIAIRPGRIGDFQVRRGTEPTPFVPEGSVMSLIMPGGEKGVLRSGTKKLLRNASR